MARRRRVPVRRPGQQSPTKGAAASRVAGRPLRVVGALALVAVAGLGSGVGLSFAFPTATVLASDRARVALLADTGASLASAAALADDEPSLRATSALALALLAVEHAGSDVERRRAVALLEKAPGAVRNAPAGLYARAVLARSGLTGAGLNDPTLDDDIARRAAQISKDPWWQLARGVRALDAHEPEEALPFLHRAALGVDAPLHARTVLVRHLLARGEPSDARALAEHVLRASPEHGPARILGALAAVVEDLLDEPPEERAVKLKKIKQKTGKRREGPRQSGDGSSASAEPSLAAWHTPEEEQLLGLLDAMDDRDGPLAALFLEALAAARGDDELARQLEARVLEAAPRRPALAARQIELSLLEGDVATAEGLLGGALEAEPASPELVLQRARLKALKLLPAEELQRRASGARALRPDGLHLPFGTLRLDPWAPNLPLRADFDPEAVPDATFLRVMGAPAAGTAVATAVETAEDRRQRDERLELEVVLFQGERALDRGDIATARAAVAELAARATGNPAVLLLDAKVRARSGDREGARAAVDAAVASAPDDPHALLTAARLHHDTESYPAARKMLQVVDALGFESPTALALSAMLDARAGDVRRAQAAIAAARRMGPESAELLGATVLVLRASKDLDGARSAADRLLALDALRSADPILRAWQADAAFRAGDVARAEAVLDDVIATRPALADAHLFRGVVWARTDAPRAAASFTEAVRLARGSAVAAEALAQRSALGGRPVAPKVAPKVAPNVAPNVAPKVAPGTSPPPRPPAR